MSVNILQGFENITKIMRACIRKELTSDGLLSDVETFIPIYHNESGVDEPCIWMVEHPTTTEKNADISHAMDLNTPFEFVCVVYENDIEEAESAGQNLANRVILAILKNYLHVQKELGIPRTIFKIDFQAYYPVGEVEIKGKSNRVPATGVLLNVIHRVNWNNCCKKINSKSD